MTNQKGFTLIELLIVIGIIAILASAVIVAINPGQQFEQARNSTRRSHLSTVASAVYSWSIENQGNFPTCVGQDSGDDDNWTAIGVGDGGTDCLNELVPTYVNQLPEPPLGSADENYQIRESAGGGNLELRSDSEEWTDLENSIIVQ